VAQQPPPVTVTSGATAQLTAAINGDAAHPSTCQWYLGTSGNTTTLVSGGTCAMLQFTSTQTNGYWMRATNSCGANGAPLSVDTAAAMVTVCSPPTITLQPAATSITMGYQPATLTVGASGSGLTFRWYEGTTGDTSRPVSGATQSNMMISPGSTTSYWAAVSNSCATTNSSSATVTVSGTPQPPTNLVATRNGSTVGLTWSGTTPPAGLSYYQVEFLVDNSGYAIQSTTTAQTNWTHSSPVANEAYVYRVRAVDQNGAPSAWSQPDTATMVTFSVDVVSGMLIRASHISQIRQAIDALRRTAGLPAQWATYAPAGKVLANDILEMRQALYEARFGVDLPPLTYTYPTIAAGSSLIHAKDVSEIQEGTR
jgi:hypothetical protein